MSLIRAGAPTHGFDQNQRYLTLAFTKDAANSRLRVVMPDHNLAPPGDYMMFVLKSNGVPSVAKWVRVHGENDNQAPAAASNLGWVQGPGPSTVSVYWTTQGDDGGPTTLRAASTHELRYSTSSITEGNWDSTTVLWSGNAKPAGELQTVALLGLDCTPLYFAVKTLDEAGNLSALSNVSEYNCESEEFASRRAVRDEGEPVAAVPARDAGLGLTRLIGAAKGEVVTVDVVNVGRSAVRIDSLGLIVAAELDGKVALAGDGQVGLGDRVAPQFLRSSSAGDVTTRIGAAEPYEAVAGEALVVPCGDGATHLLIETISADAVIARPQPGSRSRSRPGTDGSRSKVVLPQPEQDSWLVPVSADSVRLSFRGSYAIKRIDLIVPTSETPEVVEAARTALEHSGSGSLDPLSSLSASTLVLAPGERATVGFANPGSAGAGCFLALHTVPAGTHDPDSQHDLPVASSGVCSRVRTNPTHSVRGPGSASRCRSSRTSGWRCSTCADGG